MPLKAMYAALSGAQLAGQMLNASAHNTANMNTEDHHDLRVEAEEANHGVISHIRRAKRPGFNAVDNVILRHTGQLTYRANLAVIRADDEMRGTITDLIG
ncbi:MAG: hypothetical protein VX589_02525 [Myxococcota bacterium]|nr:hypothetical protein [Myxococcota bacterium]